MIREIAVFVILRFVQLLVIFSRYVSHIPEKGGRWKKVHFGRTCGMTGVVARVLLWQFSRIPSEC